MDKHKVSKEEVNFICFMLSWTLTILGYISGRILRYKYYPRRKDNFKKR
ncbi:MAG: hypothetical protein QXK88_12085 [Desulfurococcaceae archaeon]